MEKTTVIGFLVLSPYTGGASEADLDKTDGSHQVRRCIISVDQHICDSFPIEDTYSIDDEYCLKFAGTIRLFKSIHNARNQLEIDSAVRTRIQCVAIGADVKSTNHCILGAYLLDEYGMEYREAIYREVFISQAVSWIGWDVADIQGISLLHTSYKDLPSIPRNPWGLLDSSTQAILLAECGIRILSNNKKLVLGPFEEWRVGCIDS
jgi:hypothetical protein